MTKALSSLHPVFALLALIVVVLNVDEASFFIFLDYFRRCSHGLIFWGSRVAVSSGVFVDDDLCWQFFLRLLDCALILVVETTLTEASRYGEILSLTG